MRYAYFDGAGGPEVIRIGEAARPAPGPGEVLIEVVAAGVNRPDCMQRAGSYPPPPGESNIPGLEVAGRIVALGEGVTGFEAGDSVCALLGSGGYADYAVAAAPLCLPAPQGLSFEEAAALPENVFTVYDNVFTRGRLAAGETFLVHGGSSGIGSIAIQLAKASGAIVIATAGSDAKCAFCRTLGADLSINYKTQDFAAETKAFAGEHGVDVILDMVGAPYLAKNLSLLAFEGRLVEIACSGGGRVEAFNLWPVLIRRLTLTGSTLRARTLAQKAAVAAAVRERVWPLIEAGKVRPLVHATFPLEQTWAAHELMESSAHTGKIVLETGR
ncbi:NAD(P)H quinone oxidoreductase, PIG3 family [Methylocella silvestris BL2]|uniref:NAD(P)H quinone oxidoreductase, PIG3 family n=1 Tax=Methylocella silvestris (strain DSM 15510 / CIP 108128 / LMG 27833 / NCIMB 13906 / BL2) TaxID=395965 RepID=B8EL87_METSB|nr:NAD(P)H-quinone oxidoreductase [Methylocella silvestris]ACK49082.1 NAD(P)H quinone oxidoreductase, PIG3 family [Methylocella silvestris BL2]